MAKKHNEKVITAPESNLDDYPGKCEKQKHSKLVLLLKSEEHWLLLKANGKKKHKILWYMHLKVTNNNGHSRP